MPSLQLISDLHTEGYEHPLTFLSERIDSILHYHRPDFLVLAGDIVGLNDQSYEQVNAVFGWFAARARHILYVTGNHEYWHGTQGSAEFKLKGVLLRYPNIHWLDNSSITLDGIHFVGGTMWFPELPDTKWRYEIGQDCWSDFVEIKDFRKDHWPYRKNRDFHEYAKQVVRPDSIVVTHYLPGYRSVHPNRSLSDTNRFFVSDEQEVVFTKEPRLWFHGHTHDACDYKWDQTRVICHPYGYNPRPYSPLILDI